MNLRGIKNNLRNKIWVFLKANWKLRSGINITIADDSDWFVYNEIFANKEYDTAIQLLLRSTLSDPLILDLGANVGYFALKIADELKQVKINNFRIVAVEASPTNFATLKRRMAQPSLKQNVKVYLGLAGHKTGSEIVSHSQQHYGHSVTQSPAGGEKAVVNYLDIETLINNTERIAFLKCDIEGSEEVFIKEYGSLLNRVDNAVFEFHADECNVDNCRKMLGAIGLNSRGVIKQDPQYKTSVEFFDRK